MADSNSGFGGFSRPGGSSRRDENKDTELTLPGLQGALRSVVDIIAALLVLAALLILGRWVIYAIISLFFFSEAWDKLQDNVIGKFYGAGAVALEVAAIVVKWGWIILGYQVLRLVVPVEWSLDTLCFRRAVLEPGWPFVWGVAATPIPFRPLARLICLIVCIAPLLSWKPLRDRLKWSLWEFTPFGPVDASTQGIDPHKWGPQVEKAINQNNDRGVIFEVTDYEPHTQKIGDSVYVSNGSGRSSIRVDMRWITDDQWRAVAQALIINQAPFSEETLGRGRIFPTHGPYSETYKANLGFRFFRAQMIEAGRAERRGTHENSGVTLTPAGIDFLRRHFLDGTADVSEDENE